ncbi:ty1-copia retrotransposon protein [Cucumis melo var. makuwa]|uniref:Ty1-copia retrotransposon protein n=1 Tax=Cucumis melo var. makuwa TaxID=1194695 RepID=A0A5A7U1H8_CUCMM|nr:ty1-copia retrotransposon protein [Cucumis melo var. makuwa]
MFTPCQNVVTITLVHALLMITLVHALPPLILYKLDSTQLLEVDYVLASDLSSNPPATTPAPSDPESSTGPSIAAINQVKKDQVINSEKYEKDNKTVRGHLLNHMLDSLFDLFIAQKSAKDICNILKSRNLVSVSLLNGAGLKIVLEGDKIVLTKNGEFVGKGYLSNGLSVLNTVSINLSAYIVESADLWHESKFFKKPFKPVESRSTDLLELIHSDLADFKNTTSRGAKRKNRTLKEMMNAMLLSSGLSDNMWGEAVLFACFVLNRVPHKRLDKTPYELWKGHAPNLSYFKVWGCLAKVPFPTLKKLRDAEFFEHVFLLKQSLSVPCLSRIAELNKAVMVGDLQEKVNETVVVEDLEEKTNETMVVEDF